MLLFLDDFGRHLTIGDGCGCFSSSGCFSLAGWLIEELEAAAAAAATASPKENDDEAPWPLPTPSRPLGFNDCELFVCLYREQS